MGIRKISVGRLLKRNNLVFALAFIALNAVVFLLFQYRTTSALSNSCGSNAAKNNGTGFMCKYDTSNYSPTQGCGFGTTIFLCVNGTYDKPVLEYASLYDPNNIPAGATVNFHAGYDSRDGSGSHVLTWVNVPGTSGKIDYIGTYALGNPYDSDAARPNLDECFDLVYSRNSPYFTTLWYLPGHGGSIACSGSEAGLQDDNGFPIGPPGVTGRAVAAGSSVVWERNSEAGSNNNALHGMQIRFKSDITSPVTVCMRVHVSTTDNAVLLGPGDGNYIASNLLRDVRGVKGAAYGSSEPKCVTANPHYFNVGCGEDAINAGNLGSTYHFEFRDEGGALVGSSPDYTGNVSKDFNDFAFLYPHHRYEVRLVDSTATIDTKSFGPCMRASCSASIGGLSGVMEPGDSAQVTYGVRLVNDTNKAFPIDTYGARVTAGGGLSMSTNPDDSSKIFAAGPGVATTMDGPWTVTAAYGGTMSAQLLFQGNVLDGVLAGTPPCSNGFNPETRPTVSVTMGDISAGGGFKYKQSDGSEQCTLDANRYFAPVTPAYAADTTESVGGIRTFAKNTVYISGSEFAAFALGLIHSPNGINDTVKRYGFYSDRNNITYNGLSFANVGVTPNHIGGLLGGEIKEAHCAPDFYNTTINTSDPTILTVNAATPYLNPDDTVRIPVDSSGVGQAYFDATGGSPLRISGTLSGGKRVTIYVNGDVVIDTSAIGGGVGQGIFYGSWNFDMNAATNSSPYLTIITKGNIHVAPNVKTMDGVYIAQPKDDGTQGVFSTCSLGTTLPNKNQIRTSCLNRLEVNGAVIAQSVRLLRAAGTLNDGSKIPSESFNYLPSTVLGMPGFRQDAGAVINNKLDEKYSLPPVF